MKFLIDMPLSPDLADSLQRQGHDAVHASAIGLDRAPDTEIMERAAAEGKLNLKMPANWSVSPEQVPFKLPKVGAKTKVVFSVSAPSKAGSAVR